MPAEIDTTNQFAVGAIGDKLMVLRLSPMRITKEEALNLAAWLFVMAFENGSEKEKFEALVEAIQNT